MLALGQARAADDSSDGVRQKARELERLHQRMELANQAIERAKASESSERAAVEAAERKISETEAQLRRISAQVDVQDGRVHAAEAGRATAERRLDAEREGLRRQLRSAYVIGESGRLQLLLSQQEPDRADRLLTYYDYLNRASASRIGAINAEIAAVREQQQKVESELAVLREVESARRRTLTQLQADRDSRSAAIAKLDFKIDINTQDLKSLHDSEQALQALLRQLRETAAAQAEAQAQAQAQAQARARAQSQVQAQAQAQAPPIERPLPPPRKAPRDSNGRMSWPVRGELLARYGDPKADSRLAWKGLWIAAGQGTPVKASAPGRIAYTGWLSSYGLIVVIEHEKGIFTLYGHNATVSTAVNDHVDAGDVIATVGNTGGYERHGLYFEVRRGTEPVDPSEWLGR